MKITNFMLGTVLAVLLGTFTSCDKDDDNNTTPSTVNFEVTDAPIDDPNIQSVFVTVTGVKVNGNVVANFTTKQTIDLMAYRNGTVKALGSATMDGGTYNDVRLVIDNNTDASGTAPGSYVLTKDGVKHTLGTSANISNELKATNSLKVNGGTTTTAVFDFDLRKSIQYTTSGTSKYQFVSDADLGAVLRVVNKEQSGTIIGSFTDPLNLAGSHVVVYAYKKGAYTDTEAQGTGLRFKKAISSAVVGSNNQYQLSFLEAGDYSLHFVAYEDLNSDGRLDEKGMLVLDAISGLNLSNVTVGVSTSVRLDVTVTGLLPL